MVWLPGRRVLQQAAERTGRNRGPRPHARRKLCLPAEGNHGEQGTYREGPSSRDRERPTRRRDGGHVSYMSEFLGPTAVACLPLSNSSAWLMKPATSCDTAALTEHDPVSFDRTRPGPVAAEIPIVRTPSILRHLMPPPASCPCTAALLVEIG